MPPRRPAKLPDIVLRENPDTTPSLCRLRGCGKPTKARGFCSRCLERVRAAGRLDELGLPPKVGALGTRAKAPPPDIAAMLDALLLDLRHHEDGAVGGVRISDRWFGSTSSRGYLAYGPVEHYRTFDDAVRAYHAHVFPVAPSSTSEFTPEHVGGSAVARITAALGLDPTASVDGVVARIGAVAEELSASHAVVRAAHDALDAMPASNAPDCITPAQRIEYATRAWLAERKEAAHLATLCQDAHDALTEAGIRNEGTLAERIGRLVDDANRREQEGPDGNERILDALDDLLTERGSVTDDVPVLDRVRAVLDQRDAAREVDVDLHRFRDLLGMDARTPDAVVLDTVCRRPRGLRTVRYLIDALDDAGPESAEHIVAALRAEVSK